MTYALLVGFGSVGKRHLAELSTLYDFIDVVDPKLKAINIDRSLISDKVKFVENLSELEDKPRVYSIAVIATWGPTHLDVVREVINFKPNFILIEKPVESSLSKVDEIETLVRSNNIRATVNFHLRYGPLMKVLSSVINERELGAISTVSITAGAKCIATNGIHYLDLFMEIFQETPVSINSNLYSNKINPRNAEFNFLGGVVNYQFSDNKTLTMMFSNNSYAEINLEINLERGKIIFANSVLKDWTEKKSDIFENRPITRTLRFNHLLETYPISTEAPLDGISTLYKLIYSNSFTFEIQKSMESTRQILRACIASANKITLDSMNRISDEDYRRDWLIS